jgi:hypothetical protein
MSEKQVPLPLSGEEVRNAILYRVDESLRKTCNLSDSAAYTSFRGTIEIRLTLSDYGREVTDNHNVTVAEEVGLEGEAPREVTTSITIEPAAPNTVRVETKQDVPVKTTEEGRTVIKKVKYQVRKGTRRSIENDYYCWIVSPVIHYSS